MEVVILGAGRRGVRLARHLIEEKKNVTLIDIDPDRCTRASTKLDCMAITGSGTDASILSEAGCDTAQLFIALSDSDEVNLVSCAIVSSQFKTPRTVAAIRSMRYTGDELKAPLLGINYIINPYEEVSQVIRDVITSGVFLHSSTFPNTPFTLFSLPIRKTSPVIGKQVMELRDISDVEFVIAGIQRNGKTFLPSGKTCIEEGDQLALVTFKNRMGELLSGLDSKRTRPKKICIVGAGKIASFIIKMLPKSLAQNVAVIDVNETSCMEFARKHPETLIIRGDITEESIWEDESLQDWDLLISLTDRDELNIIAASYAKHQGVKHAVALVKSNPNYAQMGEHFNIDLVISSTLETVDSVLRFVRGENLTSFHSIFNGEIEVCEYCLNDRMKITGKKLKDLNFAGRMIITSITDSKGSTLATGNYRFKSGDTVLVAIPHGHIRFAQEWFE